MYHLQYVVTESQQVQRNEMLSIQNIILPWLKTETAEYVLFTRNHNDPKPNSPNTPLRCGGVVQMIQIRKHYNQKHSQYITIMGRNRNCQV